MEGSELLFEDREEEEEREVVAVREEGWALKPGMGGEGRGKQGGERLDFPVEELDETLLWLIPELWLRRQAAVVAQLVGSCGRWLGLW